MADALFSKTQQSVLALLFGFPDKSFYTNEIIRSAGMGTGAVQRELSRLLESGLVSVEKIGSQKHYQANPDSPIFNELVGILRKTAGLADKVREGLLVFEDQIDFAFVYGSVSKNKDSANSDIDLMVISNSLIYADIFPVIDELSHKLAREISTSIYSLDDFVKRFNSGNSFVRSVVDGPKIWVIGKEGDFKFS